MVISGFAARYVSPFSNRPAPCLQRLLLSFCVARVGPRGRREVLRDALIIPLSALSFWEVKTCWHMLCFAPSLEDIFEVTILGWELYFSIGGQVFLLLEHGW